MKVEAGSSFTPELSLSRPADVLVKHWTRGVPATFELIVTSLIPLSLPEASVTAGTAALMAEQRKHQANGPKCYTLGLNCIPLAVESYGN